MCEPFCVPMLLSAYAGLSNDDASMCSGLGSVMGCWESHRFPFVMIPGHEMFRVGWYDYRWSNYPCAGSRGCFLWLTHCLFC